MCIYMHRRLTEACTCVYVCTDDSQRHAHVCMRSCAHALMCVCVHVRTCAWRMVHVCIYVHVRICALYVHVHMRMCTWDESMDMGVCVFMYMYISAYRSAAMHQINSSNSPNSTNSANPANSAQGLLDDDTQPDSTHNPTRRRSTQPNPQPNPAPNPTQPRGTRTRTDCWQSMRKPPIEAGRRPIVHSGGVALLMARLPYESNINQACACARAYA